MRERGAAGAKGRQAEVTRLVAKRALRRRGEISRATLQIHSRRISALQRRRVGGGWAGQTCHPERQRRISLSDYSTSHAEMPRQRALSLCFASNSFGALLGMTKRWGYSICAKEEPQAQKADKADLSALLQKVSCGDEPRAKPWLLRERGAAGYRANKPSCTRLAAKISLAATRPAARSLQIKQHTLAGADAVGFAAYLQPDGHI